MLKSDVEMQIWIWDFVLCLCRKNSDLGIELLAVKEEKWLQIAQEVIGENADTRKSGVHLLKVMRSNKLQFYSNN